MKKKTNKSPKVSKPLVPTDTNAGITWLHSLDEIKFRDEVLEHLFRKMKKAEVIVGYQNIHGRNDKGVDYIVREKTTFGSRLLGIQAKSKPITRSETGASLSSIRIKQECDAAMEHEFTFEKDLVRLDNIELWCSNHVTEDAVQEFNAAGGRNKVQVKFESIIYSLLETYCPDLIKQIPECALALYLKEKQQPSPHSFKLLGCRLQPERHFIEPDFSKESATSLNRLITTNQSVSPKRENIKVDHIILSEKHVIIEGQSLGGKTYLLQRISWLIAKSGKVPVIVDVEKAREKKAFTTWTLIADALGFLTTQEAQSLAANDQIYLLIDNIDHLKDEAIESLFKINDANVKIISASTRHLLTPAGVDLIYLSGIKKESIPVFLRSLDTTEGDIKPFTDRAYAFITRSLGQSGLPLTPFTFGIMLGECENTRQRFTTPTFGRLIERFVEHQLGSLTEEGIRVDFETKRAFLLKLSGDGAYSFTNEEFRKRIIKFIEHSSHPHSLDDFYLDMLQSGVFTQQLPSRRISWSHPVIKMFFFVQNLIRHDKHELILKKLIKEPASTFSALVGSQLGNASKLVRPLLHELNKVPPIKEKDIFNLVKYMGVSFLPDEEQENALLERVERAESPSSIHDGEKSSDEDSEEGPSKKAKTELSKAEKETLQRDIEPFVKQLFDSRYYIAHNIAAILVNARDTNTDLKTKCVQQIVESNAHFTRILSSMFKKVLPDFKHKELLLAIMAVTCQFQATDSMLGDPFLAPIFKKLVQHPDDDDQRLILLDLLLGCGENVSSPIIKLLQRLRKLEITMAFYHRIVILYFFRFHRESEKRSLRLLLKEMRRIHKSIAFPTPV